MDRAVPPGILLSSGSAWASSASSSSACWPSSEPAAAGEGATLASEAAVEEFFQARATGVVQDLAGLVLPGSHTAMALAPHVGRAFLRVIGKYKEADRPGRSEEHTSELQSLMRISYAVFCLTKKT